MLLREIEPFADHNIESLAVVRDLLQTLQLDLEALPPGITEKVLQDNINRLNQAMNAFVRFRVCAVDEWNQKTRLQTVARDHRLHCPK